MNVPGSNLLNQALRVISPSMVKYYKNTGQITNDQGLVVASYAPPVSVKGSVQAVPKSRYEAYGLDFSKNYVTFYASRMMIDLQRAKSGDKFEFAKKVFVVQDKTDWFAIDGWSGVIAVETEEQC
jgi:hypothetical protein